MKIFKRSVQTFGKTPSIQKPRRTRAFIGIIVLIIIAILLLSYFGFNLKSIFTAPVVKENFAYVWGIIKMVWSDYLSVPFDFVWDQLIKPLFGIMWKAFLAGVEGIKSANS
jgi:hypothetical protein